MASRKEEKARLRAERESREREAAADARRKRLVGYGAAGVLALGALVAIVVVALAAGGGAGEGEQASAGGGQAQPASDFPVSSIPPRRATNLTEAARAAGCTTESFRSEGRNHVPGEVDYKSKPAHSGPHNPVPAEDGFYLTAPPTENLVHSLEHGRILVQYKPSASDELKAQLGALFKEDPYHVNVVPNAEMPYEVAATAWTEVLGCRNAGPEVFDAIRAFKERHRDRAPEFVP